MKTSVMVVVGAFGAVVLAGAPASGAHAQGQALPNVFEAPGPTGGKLSPQLLDRLVAPIALYPDEILTDILAASTYPAQVVEAHRWAAQPENAGAQGTALTDAAAQQDWDPSVQALVAFPQVLAMMDTELSWTERLGRAFMTQQDDVMNAVQRLRHAAQAAGALQNNAQASVVDDSGTISINPPSPQDVYLPTYNAECVYGPAPDCAAGNDFVAWDDAIYLPYGDLAWGFIDWNRHAIRFHDGGHGQWNHSAESRGPDYRGGHAGGAENGAVWHHQGPMGAHFASVSSAVARSEHFNYATPPLQQRYDIGMNGRPIGHGDVPFARGGAPFTYGGGRGGVVAGPHVAQHPAPALRAAPAPAAHAGGGIGMHR